MIVALKLDFYDVSDPNQVFASIEFLLSSTVEPIISSSSQESLILAVRRIDLDGDIEYPILKEDEVIRRFQSMEQFYSEVDTIVHKIKKWRVDSEFNTIVPSVISQMDLPNTWKYLNGYEADFIKFDYAEGLLENEPSGYLFMIFSVRSLMTLPPCSCNRSGDTTEDDPPPSDVFEEVDMWVTVGFSQRAVNEVLRPYKDFDKRFEDKYSVGRGIISGTVSHWVRYHAGDLLIRKDHVEVNVQANAGGDVSAFARDRVWGGKYGYEVAQLSVNIDQISFKGYLTTLYNKERKGTEMIIKPEVGFNDPEVTVLGGLPWPINEIVDLVVSNYGRHAVDKIKNNINSNMTVSLFFPRLNGIGDFSMHIIRTEFFENSSLIITGTVSDDFVGG